MANHNAQNERTKRKYFTYLKEAMRRSDPTVDAVAAALDRFEAYNKRRDFRAFHVEQAIAFKRHLAGQRGQRSGKELSKATLYVTCTHLKRFFQWLGWQPGYRSRLRYSDAEYFNLSDKDLRVATAHREPRVPTLEQIHHVVRSMPVVSEVDRRNRALIAFTILTGARDSAIASMKLKHIDLFANRVNQDAREVKTKFSKTFTTFFFPVGAEIRQIVAEWVSYLRETKLWGTGDPLFPATLVVPGETSRQFEPRGLRRNHWGNASPIRTIFREAFENVGLPYFNPHSFRNTLVQLGQQVCTSPEEFKAWSQNLGHENTLTTFLSYGQVALRRQGEIMRSLPERGQPLRPEADLIVDAVLKRLQILNVKDGDPDKG
jgi:integrase